MRHALVGLFAAAAMAPLSAAAQSTQPATQAPPSKAKPPAKPAAKGKTVEGVTVTGQGTETRLSIDRRSYDISKDLQTTTGSIADALRNVPAVDVDPNGNVSLRGDPNVTIMIDGRPSNLFKGPNAGQALQSLPADQIERVEVITNPTAAYSPEGTAGIINLVTKKGRGAGLSGSVRANIGGAGRRNVGTSVAYNADKLTLTGDAGWRHDPQHSVGTDDFTAVESSTGRTTVNHVTNDLRGPLEIWNARAGADYDLDKSTRISGELRHSDFRFHPDNLLTLQVFTPDGALLESVDQHMKDNGPDRRDDEGRMGFRRKFAGDDHLLTIDLSRERTREDNQSEDTDVVAFPAGPGLFRDVGMHNVLNQTQLKADYSRPMPAEGKLKTGYDLRIDDNSYLNEATRGTSAADALPDPGQTNLFLYKRTIHALYGTYEQPLGDWTVLAGLRLEDVLLRLKDPALGFSRNRDEFSAYPSLHLAYKLSDAQQLSLSYSHRVQRPEPGSLDPFPFLSGFSVRQGNPDLRNQDTHSFEAGWQYKQGASYYLATLYYRLNEHGVSDLMTDLGGGVTLDQKVNLARSKNAGLELVANNKLTKTLSYNVSANLYYTEIDAGGLDFQGKRSAFAVGGRGSLNWQATPKDLFQVNVQVAPKKLIPQGFIEPMPLVFLGYRHRFDDRLALVVTAQDPFDFYHFRERLDTPTRHERSEARGRIQSAFVGLVWSFGAANKRPRTPDFDFSPQ